MRVLVGGISQETNMFTPEKVSFADFKQYRGGDLLSRIPAIAAFAECGHEVVPVILADIIPSGPMSKEEFMLFINEFVDVISEANKTGGIDGIYLALHGAMHVTDIGSGEEYLIRALRGLLGADVPISASFDFHGNLKKVITDNLNFATAFRTAPHIDEAETQLRAVNALIKMLGRKALGYEALERETPWQKASGQDAPLQKAPLQESPLQKSLPKVAIINIPMLFPGEMAITSDFPTNSIIEKLSALIDGQCVWDVSLLCGFVWADNDYMSMSVIYTFIGEESRIKRRILEVAEYMWRLRDAFVFSVEAYEPERAVQEARGQDSGLAFISDSGDNLTAGAVGDDAYMLRLSLDADMKSTLIGGICDSNVIKLCDGVAIGQTLNCAIGGTIDPSSNKAEIQAVLLSKGVIDANRGVFYALLRSSNTANAARLHTLRTSDAVDILVTSSRYSFTDPDQYRRIGIEIRDYTTVIIKLGYLFPALAAVADRSILALTEGNTCLKTNRIKYTNGGNFYPVKRIAHTPSYGDGSLNI